MGCRVKLALFERAGKFLGKNLLFIRVRTRIYYIFFSLLLVGV